MKILDLEKLDYVVVNKNNVTELSVTIDYNNLFDLSTPSIINIIRDSVKQLNIDQLDNDKCYHFIFHVKDSTIPKGLYENVRIIIGTELGYSLLFPTSIARERESRLTVPSHILTYCKLHLLLLKQLINNKTKINKLACSVVVNSRIGRVI